jgi:hypothetical protein
MNGKTIIFIQLMLFFALACKAQVFDDFDRPKAAGDEFCRLLDTIQSKASVGFEGLLDSSVETADTSSQEVIILKKTLWFPGANSCMVYTSSTGTKVFIASFMNKYEQDGLISSFNNLLKQVQGCLPESYTRVDKKASTLLGKYFPIYDTELSYNGTGLKSDRPVYHIFIFRNWRTQMYELKMEISSL